MIQPILLFPPYTVIEYCQKLSPYTFSPPYTFITLCQKFPSYTNIWFIPSLYFYWLLRKIPTYTFIPACTFIRNSRVCFLAIFKSTFKIYELYLYGGGLHEQFLPHHLGHQNFQDSATTWSSRMELISTLLDLNFCF